jgi:transposase
MNTSAQIRVSVDVGCHSHSVAIGLASGELLEEFEIEHGARGFDEFFERIERQRQRYGGEVAVAMEGYNGYARPLDGLVLGHAYRLFNINNLKLARFKEIFPSAAKSDRLDARRGLELFQLSEHVPTARDVLQEVEAVPEANRMLKRLTRRRRALVNEKTRVLSHLQSDLQAVCPELLAITQDAENLWFLRFLTQGRSLTQLARLRPSTVLKIPGVGHKYAAVIAGWQKQARFSEEVEWVGPMIMDDARRVLELRAQIKELEARYTQIMPTSEMATQLITVPGFGLICATELAGEIGTIGRFAKESSLAVYLGMANLDNSSGTRQGAKSPKHVNTRAKAAMMTAVDRHRQCVAQSQRYYEKKRLEGKSHNQAIRALGRHLCRVLFSMLRDNRPYYLPD